MRIKQLIILALLMASAEAAAQKVTISGYVTDSGSGERMIDATVYEKVSYAGTTTNNYGFYSLPLARGEAQIVVSYLGYEALTMNITLVRDTVMNFTLTMSSSAIDAVTVTATGRQSKVESSQMSMIDIPIEKFARLPVLFAEGHTASAGCTIGHRGIYRHICQRGRTGSEPLSPRRCAGIQRQPPLWLYVGVQSRCR
jgi:hypothetical protein